MFVWNKEKYYKTVNRVYDFNKSGKIDVEYIYFKDHCWFIFLVLSLHTVLLFFRVDSFEDELEVYQDVLEGFLFLFEQNLVELLNHIKGADIVDDPLEILKILIIRLF